MFCGNCGAKVGDKDLFCPECGTKTAAASAEVLGSAPEKPKKKKKKLLLFGGLAVVLIAAVVAVLFLFVFKDKPASVSGLDAIYAVVDDDGVAYIPLMNGEILQIDDDVMQAAITPDRKTVIVLCEDGRLYVTDPELKKKHEIAEDAYSFGSARNDGFLYQSYDETDGTYNAYCVSFDDHSQVDLGIYDDLIVASGTVTTLYTNNDGRIYLATTDHEEAERIGSYDDGIYLVAVSDNGQIAVWVEIEGFQRSIVVSEDGEEFTLRNVADDPYSDVRATFSADQKMVVVVDATYGNMWVKHAGKEPTEFELDFQPFTTPGTAEGALKARNADKVSSLYVAGDAGEAYDMYNITLDGDCEKVLSCVKNYDIIGGKVFYITGSGDFFMAELDGDTLGDETRIARDVGDFAGAITEDYVYYMEDNGDDTCRLYCYSVKDDEAQLITSDASCTSGIYSYMSSHVSADGKTILFYEDVESIGDTWYNYGTLMMWTYGDDTPTRIAKDVIVYSVTSYRTDGYIDADSFVCVKYTSNDSDEYGYATRIYGDWMYFDGEDMDTYVEDVVYQYISG